MPTVRGWTVLTEGGETLTKEDTPSLFAPVPRPTDLSDDVPWELRPADLRALAIRDVLLETERGPLRAIIRPARGERVRIFTRRAVRIHPDGAQSSLSVPVLELEVGGEKVFLYIADDGIIVSTEDVNF